MDTVDEIMKSIDSVIGPALEDKVTGSVIGLFLVLYGGLAAPKLPKAIAELFKSKTFKVIVLSLIAYTASKNASIAIISVVGFIISIQTLSKFEKSESVIKELEDEADSSESFHDVDDEAVSASDESPISKAKKISDEVSGKVADEVVEKEGEPEATTSAKSLNPGASKETEFAEYKPESETPVETEAPLGSSEEDKILLKQAKKENKEESVVESPESAVDVNAMSKTFSEIKKSKKSDILLPTKEAPKKEAPKKSCKAAVNKHMDEITGYDDSETYASY